MVLAIKNDPAPMQIDADGVVRVAGTGVKLGTVITAYLQDLKPEDISRKFPTLQLADVYAVISYYLYHREEVDSYLEQERAEADQLRLEIESERPSNDDKSRLLARLGTNKQ